MSERLSGHTGSFGVGTVRVFDTHTANSIQMLFELICLFFMERKIKTLLFDSDGVLVHTEEMFFDINNKVFGEMGIPYSRHEFENHTFITNLGTTGYMMSLGCSNLQIKEFKEKRNEQWASEVTKQNLVDKVAEEVFASLKNEYKLGIVTNTNREFFNKTYHASSIPRFADFIICREDYNKGKPEPDSYLKALSMSGVSEAEAIVTEDSPRGITAAKAACLAVISVLNPVIPNLNISHADYHLKSIAELPELLQILG
jgi:beta-phosphoglucomutase